MKGIAIPSEQRVRGRLYVDEDVVFTVRQIAKLEGVTIGNLLETVLRYWIKHERPGYQKDEP